MANIFKSIFQRSKIALNLGEPMKMSLVVRTDLKMTAGKIGAQCAHAAVMCCMEAEKRKPDHLTAWLNLGQPKIVLRVASETELQNLITLAKGNSVVSGVVRDAGKTQVKAGTMTVVGIGPDTVENVDAITKSLKIL